MSQPVRRRVAAAAEKFWHAVDQPLRQRPKVNGSKAEPIGTETILKRRIARALHALSVFHPAAACGPPAKHCGSERRRAISCVAQT